MSGGINLDVYVKKKLLKNNHKENRAHTKNEEYNLYSKINILPFSPK
jgi:hypothetical protein